MSTHIVAIAQSLGHAQKLPDGSYLASCPVPSHGKGRGDHNPSLRLANGETRILVHCYGGCSGHDVLTELRRRKLFDGPIPAAYARAPEPKREQKDHRDPALAIWRQTCNPVGTLVETYLARRGLQLPPRCEVVRFHPKCPFGTDDSGKRIYAPAMIALVVGIEDNAPQAIHRTRLTGPRGKMTLGPIAGGAVKLTPDDEVSYGLGIGEGLETTLSLQRLPQWQGSPVWSLLNANGIADFPILGGIGSLAIAVDHDPAGENAAHAAARRWRQAGREVFLAKPDQNNQDLNDVIVGGR
jgi:hypothetical protein